MKFRHRIGKKNLGRRIAKGKSSESNPSVTRFRDAARAVRVSEKTPFPAFDEQRLDNKCTNGDAVLQQIPLHTMQIDDDAEERQSTKSGYSERSGSDSHLSQFTSCTNPTFDPVHRVWRSGSLLQNEVLAVLAATTEMIKEKNGTESDTEYFAALLTVIEATAPAEDESRLAAGAYLLGLVAKKADKSVARRCFSKAHQILEGKLDEAQSSIALAKLINTLGTILHRQDASIWQSSSSRLSLVKIGMFALHEKPVVRSAVRRILRVILDDPVMATSHGYHPTAGVVGEFLVRQLEQINGMKDIDSLLRLLCLGGIIMHKMPPHIFIKFAELALGLPSIPDRELRCAVFQCFRKILQQQPADTVLSFDTNVHIIDALRNFASATLDPVVTCAWMEALCESHVCLAAKDFEKSVKTLKASLRPIFQTFDSGKDIVAAVTYKVIARLVERCVQLNKELASECLNFCDEALNPRSAAVWQYVLRTESKIFEICKNAISHESFERALKTVAGLHQDAYRSVVPEIDLTVGAAVRYVGAEEVLRVLPLDLDPRNPELVVHFERSWLMPILRVNICNQSITLALHHFLPLAQQLRKRAPPDAAARKIFISISNQLWDLLPSLLNSANDFERHFPQLAVILGKTLHEQRDLRLIVLSSLRSALRYALQPDAPETRKDVARIFAYSFMRELFSLYTVSDDTMKSVEDLTGNSLKTLRYSVLETVRIYVDLTPLNVIDNFTNLAVEKAQIKTMALDQKIRILDLMAALVKKASITGLQSIFSVIHPWFAVTEVALQKKAFRILEEITKRLNDNSATQFFVWYADEINNVLDQGLDSVAMSARAALLAVYYNKLLSLTSFEDTENFAKVFLTTIVICLDKLHNIRTRSNAIKCFVKLCQQLISLGSVESKSPSNVLHPVLETVFGMFSPKQPEVEDSLAFARSSTIALNVIAQKFVRVLDASLLSRLVAHACSWIGDGRPAVRVLIIRLLRMLAKKLPDYTMQQYQELLLSAVFDGQQTADVTQKVRKANRLLLEVLVDRYGVEILMKRTDKLDWVKQLKAIAKIRRRKDRRNKIAEQNLDTNDKYNNDAASLATAARTVGADTVLDMLNDTDSEDEMEMEMDRESIGGRTRGSSVWLKDNDDDDDDMLDLLDRNLLLRKVATTRPDMSKDKKLLKLDNECDGDNTGGFKMAKDGRLIIEDLDLDQQNLRKRKHLVKVLDLPDKKLKSNSDSEANSDSDIDDSETLTRNKSAWRPGGKGIHRDVHGSNTSDNAPSNKRKCAGDKRKKGEKYEPYAYIPLSKRKGQKTEMRKLIKGAIKGAVIDSKARKMRRQIHRHS